MAGEVSERLRIEKAVYGGDGLAHAASGQVVFVPFMLPGELVQLAGVGREGQPQISVIEASADRVEPRCVHFGVCGGCQYQMASYPAQLGMKRSILRETLERAGVARAQAAAAAHAMPPVPEIQTWASPAEYGYRNRIRMRVRRVNGDLRLGYSVRGTK